MTAIILCLMKINDKDEHNRKRGQIVQKKTPCKRLNV